MPLGLRPLQPNMNYATLTSVVNQNFNSLDFNSFKIVRSGTAKTSPYTVNGTAGQWNQSNNSTPDIIEHNLGYVPAVIAFIAINGQYSLMPYTVTQQYSSTAIAFEFISVIADSTRLYLQDLTRSNGSITGATAGGYNIKYYLLQESAA